MYGGLTDRLHDLLLCGVDPSLVDLNVCLSHLQSEVDHTLLYRETEVLLSAASHPWIPSHHAYLYGPEFRACVASLCLVKVHMTSRILHLSSLCFVQASEPRSVFVLVFYHQTLNHLCISSRPTYGALRVNPMKIALLLCHISPLRCGSPSCPLFRCVHTWLTFVIIL